MSLDDLTPTQYYGPAAVRWDHPDGRVLSLHPDQWTRAQEQTARLTDEQRAHYAAIREANREHRSGCPVQRTGNCLCDYLAQWDKHGGIMPLLDRNLTVFPNHPDGTPKTADEILAENTSDRDGVFQQPGTLTGPGTLVIPDELWDDFDPAKVLPGSPEFISASEYQARQQQPTPFQLHLTDVEGNPMPTESTLLTEANEALKNAAATIELQSEHHREYRERVQTLMKSDRRTILLLTCLSAAGWALSVARGIWGF